jgi:hypothetical protein
MAIPLLEKYPDRIDFVRLSGNPAAIPLLENHKDKIDWDELSQNPNTQLLFELDYVQMKENNQLFKEELIDYVYHPDRMIHIAGTLGMDFRTYLVTHL